MKLGLGLELYRSATLDIPLENIRRADELGFHSVWTAEAYGCDALSPLAYLAAHTSQIKLATSVVQIAARTPAATAMHALTIDALAGGDRVIIGLGVSGPQIVEGWYGQPWGSPNRRLRDYLSIMRKIVDRQESVVHDGAELNLPYVGPGSVGEGKPLKSILHPTGRVELWIASGGPLNTSLAAELADGWLPMGYGSDGWSIHGANLKRGWQRRGGRPEEFEIMGNLTVQVTDDVRAAIDAKKPLTAMYVGGMGSEDHNFHREAMARRGFPEAAERIQQLWLAGRKDEAVSAVPDDYIDAGALFGPLSRIRERWDETVPAGLTGVILRTEDLAAIEVAAELTGAADQQLEGDN